MSIRFDYAENMYIHVEKVFQIIYVCKLTSFICGRKISFPRIKIYENQPSIYVKDKLIQFSFRLLSYFLC
jgi:hypothetical protein